MHEKSLQTLEFPKVLARVAGEAGAQDVRTQLLRASRGGDLTAADLVLVLATLRSARSVARMLGELSPETYPQMQELGEALPVHPQLVRRIEETVSEEGEVLDSASTRLRRLRGDVRAATQRLQQRLRTLVTEFGHV